MSHVEACVAVRSVGRGSWGRRYPSPLTPRPAVADNPAMNSGCEPRSDATPPGDDEHLAILVGQRFAQGDFPGAEEAFNKLSSRHEQMLTAFATGHVGRSSAEDVTQCVWLRVWMALPEKFDGRHFRGWLYTIARNCIADHFRPRPRATESIDVSGRDSPANHRRRSGWKNRKRPLHWLSVSPRWKKKILNRRLSSGLGAKEKATTKSLGSRGFQRTVPMPCFTGPSNSSPNA